MARHAKLAVSVPMPDRKYPVVLADPPWRFKVYGETGTGRSPDQHYPTMSIDEIAALDIPAATPPCCSCGRRCRCCRKPSTVLDAWGFTYRSHLVWAKDRVGTGYWARNKHELLLIGARGDIPAPHPSTAGHHPRPGPRAQPQAGRSLRADRAHVPRAAEGRAIARGQRAGWAAWGNQVEATS